MLDGWSTIKCNGCGKTYEPALTGKGCPHCGRGKPLIRIDAEVEEVRKNKLKEIEAQINPVPYFKCSICKRNHAAVYQCPKCFKWHCIDCVPLSMTKAEIEKAQEPSLSHITATEIEDRNKGIYLCSICKDKFNSGEVYGRAFQCIYCGQIHCDRCVKKCLKRTSHEPECDEVNKVSHYNQGGIECIEFLEDQFMDRPHEWNAVKHICRAKHKGNEEKDLKEAIWYLNRKLELLKPNPRRPNDMKE